MATSRPNPSVPTYELHGNRDEADHRAAVRRP